MTDAIRQEESMPKMKRNVGLLSASLALSMAGNVIIINVAGLTGKNLQPLGSEWTLPLAMQYIGIMLMTVPANMMMKKIGRRWGFTIGQLIGIAGALFAAYAIIQDDFVLFCAAGLVLGFHNAFWNYLRFAAADVSTPAYRSRAISYVMAGGVIAAILGPELVDVTWNWHEPYIYAGCYLAIAFLCCLTIFVLQFIQVPREKAESKPQIKETGRPLSEIAKQPLFIVAVLAGMIGYGSMSLIMSATPAAMEGCGFLVTDSTFVIQWHVLGMFAPSFFTGSLIKRYGAVPIILTGLMCNFAAVAINLSGIDKGNFISALIFLGIGWNFMFIGGTTLLTQCYRPSEQHKVQSFNDFFVSGTMALSSYFAGNILSNIGWAAVNITVTLPLVIALSAILWLKFTGRVTEQPA